MDPNMFTFTQISPISQGLPFLHFPSKTLHFWGAQIGQGKSVGIQLDQKGEVA